MRRRDLLAFAALGVAMPGAIASARAATQGVARVAFSSAINSLDPVMTIEALPLFRSIFDALTDTVADGTLVPRLAQSWVASEDAKTWRFALRPDAVWQDGAPVTPDDVVFTVQTILSRPTSLNRNYLSAIATVSRTGEHEVSFALKWPVAAWPRQMTLISIVPRHVYNVMDSAAFSAHPVGSGPYGVAAWERAGELQLVANSRYWGGRPAMERVTIVPLPDSVARLNGLLSGELDVIPLAPQQMSLAARHAHIAVQTVRSNRVSYLGFNVTNPVLQDLRLRQAIDCAIDRAAITRYLLGGLARPAGELVAPVTFGFNPVLAPTPYDPARARQLVVASGYDGTPIAFDYASEGTIPLGAQVAQAIGGFLESAGIHVQLRGTDQQTLIANWITRKFPAMYMFSYAPSTMDASLVLGSLVGKGGARYFADPAMDALQADQQAAADPVQRGKLLGDMLAQVDNEVYYASLFSDDYGFASRSDRVRFTPRADGYVLAQNLEPAQTDGIHE